MIFARVLSETLGKLRNIFLILVVINLDYAELCCVGALSVLLLIAEAIVVTQYSKMKWFWLTQETFDQRKNFNESSQIQSENCLFRGLKSAIFFAVHRKRIEMYCWSA
ncbi:MAG: hypothetical protein CML33_02345 [Rhodobacteraceae bacterium]|nr:hypothetical protein [Paracoccaceae bacterium]